MFILLLVMLSTEHNSSYKQTPFPDLDMSVYFPCDGGIISFLGICDGIADCLSEEDEQQCSKSGKEHFLIANMSHLMALFVQKLILQSHMRSRPMGLVV